MKTKNIYFSFTIWCLVVFSGLLTFSCDKIKDDAQPAQAEQKNEYFTRPNTPFVINMTNRHTITQNTTIRLKNPSARGTAQFMGRDFLVYTPNDNIQNATDNINYEICNDGNCQDQNINVQISNNVSPSAQDSLNTCLQTTFSAVGTIYLANPVSNTAPIYLNVTQNGYLCANYNLSTFQLLSPPSRGTAQASQIPGTTNWGIKYTYNPSSSAQSNPDYFVYSITLVNGNVAYGVGVVYILDNGNCQLNAVMDIFNNVPSNQIFTANIFANDQYCLNNLLYDTLQSFKIIEAPVGGQIVERSLNSSYIKYKSNNGFVGIDSLKYQLKYQNGTTSQAWVRFNVVCGLVGDSYQFPNSQIVNNTINLSVLDNDVLCNSNYTLSLPVTSVSGATLSVVNNNQIRVVLPNASFTGNINFSYQVMAGGAITTANVSLTIF